jgi:hypothetical protein
MTDPTASIDNVSQDLEESGPVSVVEEDVFSHIPTAGDVVDCTLVF